MLRCSITHTTLASLFMGKTLCETDHVLDARYFKLVDPLGYSVTVIRFYVEA